MGLPAAAPHVAAEVLGTQAGLVRGRVLVRGRIRGRVRGCAPSYEACRPAAAEGSRQAGVRRLARRTLSPVRLSAIRLASDAVTDSGTNEMRIHFAGSLSEGRLTRVSSRAVWMHWRTRSLACSRFEPCVADLFEVATVPNEPPCRSPTNARR